jgi:hypothetical protein
MTEPTVKRLLSEAKFEEVMVYIVSGIFRETNAQFAALEAKLTRLETAMAQFKFVGQWAEFKTYKTGNFVSMGGQVYHANVDTNSRPGTDSAWTLACKSGRDGRDGKDAPPEPRTVRAERSSDDLIVRRR